MLYLTSVIANFYETWYGSLRTSSESSRPGKQLLTYMPAVTFYSEISVYLKCSFKHLKWHLRVKKRSYSCCYVHINTFVRCKATLRYTLHQYECYFCTATVIESYLCYRNIAIIMFVYFCLREALWSWDNWKRTSWIFWTGTLRYLYSFCPFH